MKDTDYKNIREFTVVNGYLKPYNEKALEITTETGEDEIISFIEVTHRDIKFHRAYFAFLNEAWDYFPKENKPCEKDYFYIYLKGEKELYNIKGWLSNGLPIIEWQSISFSKLSELGFVEYVKNQLPFLYDLYHKYFEADICSNIIDTLEENFKNFLRKL